MTRVEGCEIVILGTGVSALDDLSPRAARLLATVDQIVTIIRAPKHEWLPRAAHDLPVHDLYALYSQDQPRVNNYLRAAQHALELAKHCRRTALVTPGSPSVFDRLVSLVVELGHEQGVAVQVVPAVSAIEGILAMLAEDLAPGIQIFEARWLFHNDIALTPQAAALLFQPGAFSTDRMPTFTDASPLRLEPLVDYLSRFYPRVHPLAFVRAPLRASDAGYLRWVRLHELCRGNEADLQGTSLYLPSLLRVPEMEQRWLPG